MEPVPLVMALHQRELRIEPAEIQRVNFEEMICPSCGERFDAKKPRSN